MRFESLADCRLSPPRRNHPFQRGVVDHLAAGGFVGFAVGVGEVELHEPVVVQRLGHRLQLGVDAVVAVYFGVEGGEDGGDFLLSAQVWKLHTKVFDLIPADMWN